MNSCSLVWEHRIVIALVGNIVISSCRNILEGWVGEGGGKGVVILLCCTLSSKGGRDIMQLLNICTPRLGWGTPTFT